jgi:hypothetical protein
MKPANRKAGKVLKSWIWSFIDFKGHLPSNNQTEEFLNENDYFKKNVIQAGS